MREKTSAEVLGVHFRYVKACAQSLNLSDFEVTVGYIPYLTSYTPKEWYTSINTMIEKKVKANLIKDLCIINLIEVDFNFNNKVIERALIYCIEINKLLSLE